MKTAIRIKQYSKEYFDLAATNVALLERLMPTLMERAPDAVFVLERLPLLHLGDVAGRVEFVAFDERLRAAAIAEGLRVEP